MTIRTHAALALIWALVLGGCADTATFTEGDGAPLDLGAADASGGDAEEYYDFAPPIDVGGSIGATMVYVHTADSLYRVDPDSLAVSLVGPFVWPAGAADEMTDIAIDANGDIVGVSFDKVYAIDAQTAECTFLAPLSQSFNGLSFVVPPTGQGPEVLMATALDGSIFRIDPASGASTRVGSFGSGLSSSGDLVSVRDFGTVATVRRLLGLTDLLARVDPATGSATVIGDTGFAEVWGLGFWGDKVYGFTRASQFILIDVTTGRGQQVSTQSNPWWGAGVTTIAPVIK